MSLPATANRHTRPGLSCCSPKPDLSCRDLLGTAQALELAEVFKVLANDTRLRLLHALAKAEELCVSELCQALDMKPQAISNQLQRLADRGIVACRRNGTSIHYRIVDPCVIALLDRGLCLVEDAQERKP